jgi:hypothetical protein
MKRTNIILGITFLFTCSLIQAQEEKSSKFNISGFSGIGYAIIEYNKEPNYNLNCHQSEFLLNYKFDQTFGIATGFGYAELTGNGFNSAGNFYQERTTFKLPILITVTYNFSEIYKIIGNLGIYAQGIIEDEYRFQNKTTMQTYNGVAWNFGLQTDLILPFKVSNNFSLGINIKTQSDFNKISLLTNDYQKVRNLNLIGLIAILEL